MKKTLALIMLAIATIANAGTSTLSITNLTKADTVVYFAFGADSVIVNWSFCPTTSRLNCQFTLKKGATKALPLNGQYLNATISFGAPVTCNTTKAELNINNPNWYDVADVSLVDGYNGKIAINAGGTKLGPPLGPTGNERVLGLFPMGCDICVARQNPPCGMTPGKDGCKTGPDQYHPDVICQWQGTVKGGGTPVKIGWLGK
jgi:hypothetical protein